MGTGCVILSCSAIFSLTIMDGFGAPLGSWRKERKRKSRVGRSSSGEQKKSLPSPLFVPSFIRLGVAAARRAVASPARPRSLSPALPRSLPPRPIRRRGAVAVAVAIALPPRPPDGQFVRTTILIQIRSCAAKERGRQTDRGKGASPLLPCRILAFHALGISVSLPGRIVTLKKGNEEPQYQKIEREKWRGEYLGFPARASCPRCQCCAAPRPTHLVTNHALFRQRGVGTCRKLLTFRVRGRGSAKSKSTFTGIHSRIK